MDKGSPALRFSPSVAARLRDREDRIVVLGGSGWLGQATLEMLEQALGPAFAERVMVFGSRARDLGLRSGRVIPCHALADLGNQPNRPSIVMHYAFLTKERVVQVGHQAYLRENQTISDTVAGFFLRLDTGVLFLPSSGAVYRHDGAVDDDLVANPYGAMKVQDERRFDQLRNQTGRRVITCRVFNLAGPFINKLSDYVLSSILLDILRGGPIVLRATGPVFRSYIHIRDLVDLAFGLAVTDVQAPAAPFDTAGDVTVEVGDLAIRARRGLDVPGMEIQRPPWRNGTENRYVGDGRVIWSLMAQMGIVPCDLDQQIRDVAAFLKSS